MRGAMRGSDISSPDACHGIRGDDHDRAGIRELAKDGAITLEDDVILTSTASIKQDMTINLNGHTLTNGTPKP